MSNSVSVTVAARLHLGFLDLGGQTGRRFGSIGLPLSDPETVVTLSRAPQTSAEGSDSGRARQHLATLCNHLGIRAPHRLVVERSIPPHAGLGSGTQIALAVAAALRKLHGIPFDIAGDAVRLGRGARSGVGIASFERGGLIVDAGKDEAGSAPTVAAQIPFPEEWRVILVMDTGANGIHGADEIAAFAALPPFPQSSAAELCRQALMGVLPGVVERDFEMFGAAISTIQSIVGEYFAPAQGGVFTSKRVAVVIDQLAWAGAVGIGQSSWGPTGFAFAPSAEAASRMAHAARETAGPEVEIKIVSARNSGAEIRSVALDLVGS
jgi:beta-RFAP synthase